MSRTRFTTGLATVVACLHAKTVVALAASSEDQPLNLAEAPVTRAQTPGPGGGGLARTLVGLAIVIGVIWGLSWVLRQIKSGREERGTGRGLASLATLPLGANRSLHVVRAGQEVLLVGVSEQQVTPLRVYSEAEAQAVGLVGDEPALPEGPRAGATAVQGVLDQVRSWTVRR